ncbi:tetratricopeptide repeat-containing sensor histidine kinase [Hymenobacter sediminicola]|uniref:histidine kinase n=1 Tax=Hymenobacter sediminicola TaxID=2761579 RepID=A0A7G7W3D4_9BACT|nr:tetratricopeptide repeat-containing sensor histidine kinase [Hymenobacter sediminicola]QNH60877.1 tetratricopeptide repeat-containing sensor histidine kinase [Hymenobacter sediminicola]
MLSGVSIAQNAQPAVIDSLKRQLAAAPANDTLRVYLLDELCWNLSRSDLPKARSYAEEGIALAQRIGYTRGEARCHQDLGTCLSFVGAADEALQQHFMALRLFRKLGMKKAMGYAYNGIANCHNLRHDFTTAESFYIKALVLAEQRRDSADEALFLSNLADLTWQHNQLGRASRYIRRALSLYTALNNLPGQANSLYTLGNVHLQQEHPDSARASLREALVLYQMLGDEYGISGTYSNLSAVMLKLHQPRQALTNSQLGLRYARRVGSPDRVQNAYQQLSDVYARLGQYQLAYQMQQRFQHLRDSLMTEANTRAMESLQNRYDTHERESRIRLLTQQQRVIGLRAERDEQRVRLLGVVVGGLLLLVVVGSVLYGQLLRGREALAARNQVIADKNTALEQAAYELQALAESKARLYAIIAHDLRGPITAFAGVAQLINFYQRTNDQDSLHHLPAIVHDSAQNLNSLLDNLLNWAASQTGELRCQPERIPVRELLAECYELFQTSAHANQVQLQFEADPNLLLYADRNMVRTILRNLVSNALKFTPANGTVRLHADIDSTDPTQIHLAVTDTGPGLQASQMQQIMHPESAQMRAAGLNRTTQGTGLGLQLCRTFSECHGGSLGMRNSAEGGTEVWVTLPSAGMRTAIEQNSARANQAYTAA